ncbi:hypothetical protein DFP72DRAFT_856362 [Ephemerocybe angulata]|uniref:Uncharacterized protein n=1 Tax=Ephemerocybe angulata TaxID=980116 RepID=A0A8H6HEX2_9AGAR|nr:hypothetical protein DFP72DRAFT_856362 [Tulosesus angulatus]
MATLSMVGVYPELRCPVEGRSTELRKCSVSKGPEHAEVRPSCLLRQPGTRRRGFVTAEDEERVARPFFVSPINYSLCPLSQRSKRSTVRKICLGLASTLSLQALAAPPSVSITEIGRQHEQVTSHPVRVYRTGSLGPQALKSTSTTRPLTVCFVGSGKGRLVSWLSGEDRFAFLKAAGRRCGSQNEMVSFDLPIQTRLRSSDTQILHRTQCSLSPPCDASSSSRNGIRTKQLSFESKEEDRTTRCYDLWRAAQPNEGPNPETINSHNLRPLDGKESTTGSQRPWHAKEDEGKDLYSKEPDEGRLSVVQGFNLQSYQGGDQNQHKPTTTTPSTITNITIWREGDVGRRRVSGVVGSEEELPGVIRREGDVVGADGKRPASLDVMETRWGRVGSVQRCWARKQPGGGRNKAPGAAERKGDAAGGDTSCPASLGARKTWLGGETKCPAPWDAKETWWCQMRSLWDMWT